MSLDSRRTGFPRLNSSSNNVFTTTAQPGFLAPDQQQQQQQSHQSAPASGSAASASVSATGDQADNSSAGAGAGAHRPQEVEITYSDLRTIGNGSFGVVFQATLLKPTQEQIAIKKVLQDRRFKNRELQIMRKLDHCNVVKLKYFFHSMGDRGSSEIYLHLVLEYIPETLYKIARTHSRTRQNLPMILVKLYMYQLFRSLNYIHSMDICHRDIKPQNLLLNPDTGVLKLCDFGSAKSLVNGEPNVAYICSRYYRAPELIFGATDYTTKIDIWSAGCVMAELILGEPMFPGESGVDQLVEIIKVLGTPSREQMKAMNSNYTEFRFPVIRARSWNRIFSSHLRAPPEAAKLVSNLLEYTPSNRLTPLAACAHPFFDELRSSSTKLLPNGREMPPLFNFSEEELRREQNLAHILIPSPNSQAQASSSGASGSANAGAAASNTTTTTSTGPHNTTTTTNPSALTSTSASTTTPATSTTAGTSNNTNNNNNINTTTTTTTGSTNTGSSSGPLPTTNSTTSTTTTNSNTTAVSSSTNNNNTVPRNTGQVDQ